MLGALFDGRRPLEHVGRTDRRAVRLLGRDDVRDGRLALGDRAGLVEEHCAGIGQPLERCSAPNQNPILRRFTRPDQNRRGRREPERARTGDDQDRHERHGRKDERAHLRRRSQIEPGHERRDRDGDHDRDEHPSDAIGEFLNRSLRGLGVFDELHDLAEGGFLAHTRRAKRDAAGRVQRTTDDFVTGLLGHRHRLTREHRFVHR